MLPGGVPLLDKTRLEHLQTLKNPGAASGRLTEREFTLSVVCALGKHPATSTRKFAESPFCRVVNAECRVVRVIHAFRLVPSRRVKLSFSLGRLLCWEPAVSGKPIPAVSSKRAPSAASASSTGRTFVLNLFSPPAKKSKGNGKGARNGGQLVRVGSFQLGDGAGKRVEEFLQSGTISAGQPISCRIDEIGKK